MTQLNLRMQRNYSHLILQQFGYLFLLGLTNYCGYYETTKDNVLMLVLYAHIHSAQLPYIYWCVSLELYGPGADTAIDLMGMALDRKETGFLS